MDSSYASDVEADSSSGAAPPGESETVARARKAGLPVQELDFEPTWITALQTPIRESTSPQVPSPADRAGAGEQLRQQSLDQARDETQELARDMSVDASAAVDAPRDETIDMAITDGVEQPRADAVGSAREENVDQPRAAGLVAQRAATHRQRQEAVTNSRAWAVKGPLLRTIAPVAQLPADERELADALDMVISDLKYRQSILWGLIDKLAPVPDESFISPWEEIKAGQGPVLLAEDRERVRELSRLASDTDALGAVIKRTQLARKAAGEGTAAQRSAELRRAAVFADEALMLHVIATIRLHLAALARAELELNVDIGRKRDQDYIQDYIRFRDMLWPLTQRVLDAAAGEDHEAAHGWWKNFEPELDATLKQLAVWSVRQHNQVVLQKSVAATAACLLILQAGAAVYGGAGGSGGGPFPGGGAFGEVAMPRLGLPALAMNQSVIIVSGAAKAALSGTNPNVLFAAKLPEKPDAKIQLPQKPGGTAGAASSGRTAWGAGLTPRVRRPKGGSIEQAGEVLDTARRILGEHDNEALRANLDALDAEYWQLQAEASEGGMKALKAFEDGFSLQRRAGELASRIGSTIEAERPFDNAAFQKSIKAMQVGERMAAIQETADEIAARHGWEYDQEVSAANRGFGMKRRVYFDPAADRYYSVDWTHGTLEECNGRGTHLREVDFNLKLTDSADKTGGHDLVIP